MSETSRLSRWSQRKLAARRGGALPEAEVADTKALDKSKESKPVDQASLPAGSDVSSSQEEMLTEADLPSIDELTAESDYSAFMQKNVPEVLRKRALRSGSAVIASNWRMVPAGR